MKQVGASRREATDIYSMSFRSPSRERRNQESREPGKGEPMPASELTNPLTARGCFRLLSDESLYYGIIPSRSGPKTPDNLPLFAKNDLFTLSDASFELPLP